MCTNSIMCVYVRQPLAFAMILGVKITKQETIVLGFTSWTRALYFVSNLPGIRILEVGGEFAVATFQRIQDPNVFPRIG